MLANKVSENKTFEIKFNLSWDTIYENFCFKNVPVIQYIFFSVWVDQRSHQGGSVVSNNWLITISPHPDTIYNSPT